MTRKQKRKRKPERPYFYMHKILKLEGGQKLGITAHNASHIELMTWHKHQTGIHWHGISIDKDSTFVFLAALRNPPVWGKVEMDDQGTMSKDHRQYHLVMPIKHANAVHDWAVTFARSSKKKNEKNVELGFLNANREIEFGLVSYCSVSYTHLTLPTTPYV